MSPLLLRRYRADRLPREEFDRLHGRVVNGVRASLRSSGVTLDPADLDACYSQAWQGLYAAVLEGQEIGNTAGWLFVAALRRAIDEHRSQSRARLEFRSSVDEDGATGLRDGDFASGAERDLSEVLDDRTRLRQFFEGLLGRLSERELQAATLCYLQGFTRAEAAQLMGISTERMRKLMEGDGQRRPGVAAKVGALAATIARGDWCDEQGSLMRALAFGMLDSAGERHRIAELHRSECPACRAYVLSLRGLASVLPPLPSVLHLALGTGAAGVAGAGGVAGASLGGATGAAPGAGTAAQSAPAIGGTLAASGAAGAGGAAGGGWLLAGGSLSAKLAMGCLLALTVGAGCVALSGGLPHVRLPQHRHAHERSARAAAPAPGTAVEAGRLAAAAFGASATRRSGVTTALTPAGRAIREFGPERSVAAGEASSASSSTRPHATATAASGGFEQGARSGSSAPRATAVSSSSSRAASTAVGSAHAEREFGIG